MLTVCAVLLGGGAASAAEPYCPAEGSTYDAESDKCVAESKTGCGAYRDPDLISGQCEAYVDCGLGYAHVGYGVCVRPGVPFYSPQTYIYTCPEGSRFTTSPWSCSYPPHPYCDSHWLTYNEQTKRCEGEPIR